MRGGQCNEKLVDEIKKADQKVQNSPVRFDNRCQCVCVCSLCVFLCIVKFLQERVCLCFQEKTATGKKQEVWGGGQSGIKGSAAMNVIQIKPSRILRFSL